MTKEQSSSDYLRYFKFVPFLYVIVFGISALAFGETATTSSATPDSTVSASAPAPASEGKIIGTLDIRPTVNTKAGTWGTENYLELGYKFNKDEAVTGVVFFNTNLNDRDPSTDSSLNLTFPGAFVRAKFNNIWNSADQTLSLGYQPRVYMPTTQGAYEKGQVAVVRNYLTFTKKVTDSLSLSFVELPMVHFYSKAGHVTASGAAANPVLENRIYLVADVTIAKNLSISLPLYFHATKHRNFQEGAKNNSAVTFFVYTWPELTYSLTDNASLGLAFYTGNWVEDDLSGFRIGDAFAESAAQVALTLSL